MSHDIALCDPVTGETLELDEPHQMRGGTYVMSGTTRMELNITYNYGHHYRRVISEGGITAIYGMTGAESLPILKAAMKALADDVDDNDYWNATEGNAKRALAQLAALAALRPDGVWNGD